MAEFKSGLIASCEHDAETAELTVTFHKGGCYVYTGVDAEMHERLLGAESVGSFFHHNVRGKFPHSRKED